MGGGFAAKHVHECMCLVRQGQGGLKKTGRIFPSKGNSTYAGRKIGDESFRRFYKSCDQACLLRTGKVLERPSYLFSLS